MSARDLDGPWYPPPSVPLPADGIRARSARGRIGETWWSGRFIAVLESFGMGTRLTRGRRYARSGQVLDLDVAPGLATAVVQGSRRAPYRVQVSVATLSEREWARAELALAAEARFMAALLAGEMPTDIEEAFAGCKLSLFPASRRAMGTECSCPDWANPCKHAAAVCYLVADELDADPFALLALRGRQRDEVLAALRRLRSVPVAATRPAVSVSTASDQGMAATEAWARDLGDLPIPPPPRPRPGSPAVWPVDPPRDVPFTAAGLRSLAADAAERAWLAYRGEGTTGLADDPDTDLTRRAASALGTEAWTRLVAATGTDARRLARRAIAWRQGGAAAAKAAEERLWQPGARVMASARQALVEAGAPASKLAARLNTLRVGDVQIRLGADGSWWRFERRGGAWELSSPPAAEPDDLWA